jgi:hypothetical protein
MEHQPGRLSVISWQSRRNRRAAPGLSAWTVVCVACILFGGAATVAQAAGWLRLTGLLAAIPPGLVLVAVLGQVAAVTRAVLVWLAG